MTVARKVAAGGLAGVIVTILVWILSLWHINLPGDVAAAITVVISFIVAYLVPSHPATPTKSA